MGKHDRKSRKGKIYRGTFGNRRLRKGKVRKEHPNLLKTNRGARPI